MTTDEGNGAEAEPRTDYEEAASVDWDGKAAPVYTADELYNFALEIMQGRRYTQWHVQNTLGPDWTEAEYASALVSTFPILTLAPEGLTGWLARCDIIGFHARMQDASRMAVNGHPTFMGVAFWTREQWQTIWAHMQAMEQAVRERQPVICHECGRAPEEIGEYRTAAQLSTREDDTPTDYVMREEGTYNPHERTFWCTECYLKIGMPLGVAPRRREKRR